MPWKIAISFMLSRFGNRQPNISYTKWSMTASFLNFSYEVFSFMTLNVKIQQKILKFFSFEDKTRLFFIFLDNNFRVNQRVIHPRLINYTCCNLRCENALNFNFLYASLEFIIQLFLQLYIIQTWFFSFFSPPCFSMNN